MKKKELDIKTVNEVVGISKKILNILYVVMIIGIIFLATLLIKEWGIFTFILTVLKVAAPFFIGFAIAWLFNPLVCKLENKGLKRGLASILVYIIFILLLIGFFYLLIPTVYDQLNELISSLPGILNSLETWLTKFLSSFKDYDFINIRCFIIFF